MQKRYNGICYESQENCFDKCKDVVSTLLYGNIDNIREPQLTVLIPTYKRPNLLKQALESVITQIHTDFFWDILVLDNEEYQGKSNDTEKVVRQLSNDRILYYRNSRNIRPGDNFNRGFQLARGKWVTMLHDDDLLAGNSLNIIGKLIEAYDSPEHPLGVISAQYIQFRYDPEQDQIYADINGMNQYLCHQPVNYQLYPLTHKNVLIYGHIGGSVPSNGTTFLRKAVLEVGGFNEDFGISGDLILYYNIENHYYVYQTLTPLGFYRWGSNFMIKKESTFRVVQDGYRFREYIYSKHPFVGKLFRNCHYRVFTNDVIRERNRVTSEKMLFHDFDSIYNKLPNPVWYFIYIHIIRRVYGKHMKRKISKIAKRKEKEMIR